MSFLMSDILTTIRDLAVNELGDLGNTDDEQNAVIFRFVNVVLDKRSRQAYNVVFSDALDISADGYQTFQKDAADIADMYEPLAIYDDNNQQATKRTSYDAPKGWYRESDNLQIHTKGLTGTYTLKYIRYPAEVDADTDNVEYPRAGKWDLIMDVVALCKLPKNYYDEYGAVKKEATGTSTVKASIAAKGTNKPPTMNDREE